jgi:alpha-beta hydrolase superfamily lysophospholipase
MTTRDEGPVTRRSGDGPALHSCSVLPDGAHAAVVGIVPGYADHAARYAHVMDAWGERGIASVAIDLRGHGRAGGRRGFCERFDEFVEDAAELERIVHERGAPGFLFGHSFGGLVAVSALLARPGSWRGLVLTNPFFGLSMPVSPLKVLAGTLASRLAPALAFPSGMHGGQMTHDTLRASAYDGDPLVFRRVPARFFTESRAAQERAIARAGSLALPLYLVRGLADPISSEERARAFFDAAGSLDKTWDAREGLLHEVLNEPVWPDIADAIADWILAHAP